MPWFDSYDEADIRRRERIRAAGGLITPSGAVLYPNDHDHQGGQPREVVEIIDFGRGPVHMTVNGHPVPSTWRERVASWWRNWRAAWGPGCSLLDGVHPATRYPEDAGNGTD